MANPAETRSHRMRFAKKTIAKGIVFFAFIGPVSSSQAIMPFSFRYARELVFSAAAPTLYPNICSAVVTIQRKMGGKVASVTTATTVDLTSTGGISYYSDSICTVPITTATMASGASSANIYAMGTAVGAASMILAASGFATTTLSTPITANPFVWTGGASTNIWSTGGNWSGGVAPNASQTALFDNSCSTYCAPTFSANASVGGVKIMSSFTGTITQNSSYTFTTGSSGWVQLGGTYEGSSSGNAMSLAGKFYLSAGSFRATSGTLSMTGPSWEISGSPTFLNNGGTVSLPNNYQNFVITPGTTVFNHFSSLGIQTNVGITGTMTIAGNLTINSTHASFTQTWSTGTANVAGNVTILGQGATGTATINLNGSLSQNLDASGATNGRVPNLTITSTGGTVTFLGTIIVTENYDFNSGTLAGGTSTLYMSNAWQTRSYSFGTETYNNVTFSASNGQANVTGTPTVAGTLTLRSTNSSIGNIDGGTLIVTGNLVGESYGMEGSTIVRMAGGTADTSIDYSTATAGSRAPKIEVAKTAGNLNLLGIINFTDSWVWSGGTIVAGTSTIALRYVAFSPTKTFTPGAGQTYNDVTLAAPSGSSGNITTTLNAANITLATSGADYDMPTPGAGLSINATGTLTVNSGVDFFLNGATKTHGTLVNNGTITP